MALEPNAEIKSIIDKTANFVARLGGDFEKRIFENEQANPKFSFLKSTDPFYPFYQKRIQYFKETEGKLPGPPPAGSPPPPIPGVPFPRPPMPPMAMPPGMMPPGMPPPGMMPPGMMVPGYPPPPGFQPPGPPPAQSIDETISEPPRPGPTSLAQRIIAIAKKMKQRYDPPPPDLFILEVPPDINALDLDIIKLTAQFVARNGHQFQVGLMNREHKNAQFDFLKQNHPLHALFLGYVETFTRCLLPPRGITDKIKAEYSDPQAILDRLIVRYHWEKQQEEARKAAQASEEERVVAIDWHDFVIVETIDFVDEEEERPTLPPLPAPQLQPKLEPEQKLDVDEVEMETDDVEMEVEEQKKPSTQMKIVKGYVRSTVPVDVPRFQVCPRCRQNIPVDEMAEHVRIELLDPKYAQTRSVHVDRAKGVSLANDEEISRNLMSFARKRTDIFGDDQEVEIGKSVAVEKEEKTTQEKVIWDGHTGSIQRTTSAVLAGKTIDDQIAAIHATKGVLQPTREETSKPAIGPEKGAAGPNIVPPLPAFPTTVPAGPPGVPQPSTPQLQMQMMGQMYHPPQIISMPPQPPPPSQMMFPPPGLGHPPGLPHPPAMNQPIPRPHPVEEEPAAKRSKLEDANLIPEDQFASKYTAPITIQVQCPEESEKPEWKLQGQTLQVQVNVMDTVAAVKEKLKDLIGMPSNKQKINCGPLKTLADNKTLAFYNLGPNTQLELRVKARGGKK